MLYTFSGLCPTAAGTQTVSATAEAADDEAAVQAVADELTYRYGLTMKSYLMERHEHAIVTLKAMGREYD